MFASLLMFNYGRLGRLIVSSRNCATFKVLTARKSLLNGVNSELDRALIEAQELVHYSMLVLNRTRNEVIDTLRQVYGNKNHHLLEATDAAFYNNVNIQMRELILLLMSRITHHQNDKLDSKSFDASNEIVKKQLTLTEIIELIYKTNLLHQTIANHRVGESSRLKAEDWNIHYNNKLAILFGDFYVARAWASLGRLRSIDVNLLMSQGITDFTEGQFIMQSDAQLPSSSSPTPTPTPSHLPSSSPSSSSLPIKERQKDDKCDPVSVWEKRHYLMNASLPGHACQSISSVANLNLFLQEAAFKFGKNFSLCWQILTEMEPFLSNNSTNVVNSHSEHSKSTNNLNTNITPTTSSSTTPELVIDLMSLPVLLQIADSESIINSNRNHKEILIAPDSTTNSINNNQATQIDIDKLYSSITGGPIIERIRSIRNRYADEALNAINCFSKCDASCALINIINAIKET